MTRALTVLIPFLLCTLTGCRFSANFHEVDPGRLYRSAQLTESELRQLVPKLGIKTIINLRGAKPTESWYQSEAAVAAENGVALIDIPMSSSYPPHRKSLIALLDAFRDAERPMLIHCLAGVDRTGEAVALYELEVRGKTKKQALNALTFKYFHIPAYKPAKRYFIEHVYQGEQWAREVYDPCIQTYKYYVHAERCLPDGSVASLIEDEQEEADYYSYGL